MAQRAICELGLTQMLMVLAPQSVDRKKLQAPPWIRRSMLEVVCVYYSRPKSRLQNSHLEWGVARNTSIQSAIQLRNRHPHAALFMVLGLDRAIGFMSWHQPMAILEYCNLAIVPRRPYRWRDLPYELRLRSSSSWCDALAGEVLRLNIAEVKHSSTDIRKQIQCKNWTGTHAALAPPTQALIRRKGLYLDELGQ